MKISFFNRISGPHFFLTLIFILLGVLMLILSVRGYKDYSQRDIEADDLAYNDSPRVTFQELEMMFGLSLDSAGTDYQVVAQKNLFSPEREAWQAPERQEEEVDTRPARSPRVNPQDFKLYGITRFQDERKALVYYQHSSQDNKHSLLREGESAQFGTDDHEAFQVEKIDQESVSIKVGQDIFEVSLYGHERKVSQGPDTHFSSIVVGGRPSDAGLQAEAHPESGPDSAEGGSRDGPGSEASGSPPPSPQEGPGEDSREQSEGDGAQPGGLADLLQRMRDGAGQGGQSGPQDQGASRNEEMESRVQEGTMRRIDTPFGPVYRPVD